MGLSAFRRWLLIGAGCVCVLLGGIGIVVPGLPTTVFFIVAAWCFTRSSPRLEAWVLGLPGIGPAVRSYRAGEGMPRRAKVTAIMMIVAFSSVAIALLDSLVMRTIVGAVAVIGVVVVARIRTRPKITGPPG
jgi:uncharacterized protein